MELKDTVKGMPKVYYFNSNESMLVLSIWIGI